MKTTATREQTGLLTVRKPTFHSLYFHTFGSLMYVNVLFIKIK